MNPNGTMTMEECQRAWAEACRPPEIERPACYNRAEFSADVASAEFAGLAWTSNWRPGCPHWYPGGNAYSTGRCESSGGKSTPWRACGGCRLKHITKEAAE